MATKIAAHAADIAKGVPGARDRDNRMSDARRRVAWDEMFELSLDPARARAVFESAPPSTEGTCTMCGKMCAMKTVNDIMEENGARGAESGRSSPPIEAEKSSC